MDIKGKITGIKYTPFLTEKLSVVTLDKFDINTVPATCLITSNKSTFAVSKWVSPKRTRSYPFERVYNSLATSKKITVIPIIKDEGIAGDRDFIQWDTVSLMSLLDTFVILAYYDKAEINPRNSQKITNQQFNNPYVISKIKEIEHYHSSALHWNLNELNLHLTELVDKVTQSYQNIANITKVPFHNPAGIENFKAKIEQDVAVFMNFSRSKAKEAQAREFVTLQPKERLATVSKAKITIENYLGGLYFFTVDEIQITPTHVYLIESKHSKSTVIPAKSDIKDGLLKMILYCNLKEVRVENQTLQSSPVLSLTSPYIKGSVRSDNSSEAISRFITEQSFTPSQANQINLLFNEANQNDFIVKISYSE